MGQAVKNGLPHSSQMCEFIHRNHTSTSYELVSARISPGCIRAGSIRACGRTSKECGVLCNPGLLRRYRKRLQQSWHVQEGDSEGVRLPLVISSMQGLNQQLILRKRDGYEDDDVLDELDSAGAALLPSFLVASLLPSTFLPSPRTLVPVVACTLLLHCNQAI